MDTFGVSTIKLVEHLLAIYAIYVLSRYLKDSILDQLTWWSISAWWWRPSSPGLVDYASPVQKFLGETNQRFPYRRLELNNPKSFRLLVLMPGPPSSPIQARLYRTTIDQCSNRYEALSYTWGTNIEDKRQIFVDGHALTITASLYDALHTLRRTDRTRTIWCDQVCITQHNVAERNHQVALMADIYFEAAEVQIWLGDEDRYTEPALQLLSHFVHGTDKDIHGSGSWLSKFDSFTHEHYVALMSLLSRAWFSRVWVVQEAALSRKATLVIGQRSVTWDHEKLFRFLMRVKFAEVQTCFHPTTLDLSPLRQLLEMSLKVTGDLDVNLDLLDLVHDVRHRNSTDPRDGIYSVLGMIRDVDFQVDYSLEPATVFANLYHYTRIKRKARWEGTSTSRPRTMPRHTNACQKSGSWFELVCTLLRRSLLLGSRKQAVCG